ncbi:hypothetical protein IE985_08100 [Klebsiella pneumoniae]|nr:hypothetical protein [Klebsiella pneumoniae]
MKHKSSYGRMIHSHATIFLVSLASHHEESEGILRRTAEKLTEKDILYPE